MRTYSSRVGRVALLCVALVLGVVGALAGDPRPAAALCPPGHGCGELYGPGSPTFAPGSATAGDGMEWGVAFNVASGTVTLHEFRWYRADVGNQRPSAFRLWSGETLAFTYNDVTDNGAVGWQITNIPSSLRPNLTTGVEYAVSYSVSGGQTYPRHNSYGVPIASGPINFTRHAYITGSGQYPAASHSASFGIDVGIAWVEQVTATPTPLVPTPTATAVPPTFTATATAIPATATSTPDPSLPTATPAPATATPTAAPPTPTVDHTIPTPSPTRTVVGAATPTARPGLTIIVNGDNNCIQSGGYQDTYVGGDGGDPSGTGGSVTVDQNCTPPPPPPPGGGGETIPILTEIKDAIEGLVGDIGTMLYEMFVPDPDVIDQQMQGLRGDWDAKTAGISSLIDFLGSFMTAMQGPQTCENATGIVVTVPPMLPGSDPLVLTYFNGAMMTPWWCQLLRPVANALIMLSSVIWFGVATLRAFERGAE